MAAFTAALTAAAAVSDAMPAAAAAAVAAAAAACTAACVRCLEPDPGGRPLRFLPLQPAGDGDTEDDTESTACAAVNAAATNASNGLG
jgi:hypothetical protein